VGIEHENGLSFFSMQAPGGKQRMLETSAKIAGMKKMSVGEHEVGIRSGVKNAGSKGLQNAASRKRPVSGIVEVMG